MTGEAISSLTLTPIPASSNMPPPLADRESRDQAFTHLYEQYRGLVYAYCLRALRDRADAEDLTSEVFLNLLRASPRYRHEDLSRLIMTVTRNAIRSHFRARRSRPSATEALDDLPEPVHPSPGPEAVMLTRGSYRDLVRLIATLPPKQRVVLLLYSEGYSLDEIADRFGWSHGSTKRAAHLARRRLRRQLSATRSPAARLR